MQSVTIQRGSFTVQLYEVAGFMELPLANIRKLWKIMFDAADENREAIAAIRDWLPSALDDTKRAICAAEEHCAQTAQEAEDKRRVVTAFSSMATKEQQAEYKAATRCHEGALRRVKSARAQHERAKKLQSIFNEMCES